MSIKGNNLNKYRKIIIVDQTICVNSTYLYNLLANENKY